MFTNNREGEYTKLNNQIVATADEKGSNQQKNIKKSNNGHNKHLRKPERPSEMRGIYQQLCIFMLALVSLAVTTCEALPQEGNNRHEPLPLNLTLQQTESQREIFKSEVNTSDDLNDFALMENENSEKTQNRRKRSITTQIPSIFYIETLIIVDYDTYLLHGRNESEVKLYFKSFWHAVDLRFRLLNDPKIRITIADIIISKSPNDTPYLQKNRIGRDDVNASGAVFDMGKYLFDKKGLPQYDIAVTMTKLDLCEEIPGSRDCDHSITGFSIVGGACLVNKYLKTVESVAILEDNGGFSDINIAAHEMGHLLGAVHDGSPQVRNLKGPGGERCDWEDGYIMSRTKYTEKNFRWSSCTEQSFRDFLKSENATCLYNVPHVVSASDPPLPGKLLSLDDQCQRRANTKSCYTDEGVCTQLSCLDVKKNLCIPWRPAAEGSPCGNNSHCLDGRCTRLPSNVIPNYD